MPCNCRNEDGSLSGICFGNCEQAKAKAAVINNIEEQIRAQEDSFTWHQLRQIKMIVSEALSVSPTIEHIWMEGFIRGFKEGYEYGQER